MNDDDLRMLHSRLTDNDALVELHSADIAAILECIQALAKRLSVIEGLLAAHCGIEVKDMHEMAAEMKNGVVDEDSHEIGVVPGD